LTPTLTPTVDRAKKPTPIRRDANLYFDSSVYGFIDDAGEARAVRRWLQQSRLRVQASDEVNLGEALRTPDPAARTSRIKTIMTVTAGPTYPTDLVASEEFLREVRRNRPDWIRSYPSLASKKEYLRRRRARLWDWLKRDPSLMPDMAGTYLPVLDRVIGENVAAQKARRSAQLKRARLEFTVHVPELVLIFAGYSELEQYARYQAEVDWRLQLTDPKTPSAENDWLMPNLDGDAMSRGNEWFEFWIKEADLSIMPTTHVGAIVEYFQAERPITAGNTFDRIHAGYLVTHDRVVTADADFYDALVFVKKRLLQLRGEPVLIRRPASGSALAELQGALSKRIGYRLSRP
jgi:hypothetical protein